MSTLVEFAVAGRPAPQGSHTPVVTQSKGRAVVDPATGRPVRVGGGKARVWMKDASPHLQAYRSSVAWAARAAATRAQLAEPVRTPVATVVDFFFARPKNGRAWPDSRATGDLDKLVRAVHDALSLAGVVDDDSRIVGTWALMRFVDDAGQEATRVRVVEASVFAEAGPPVCP